MRRPSATQFRDRAATILMRSTQEMGGDIDLMLSKHSAMGRLQSGATIIAAVEIFERHSRKGLTEALEETAKLVDHHGLKWRQAMSGIQDALEAHLARAGEHLDGPFKIADRRGTPSISKAADREIAQANGRLRDALSDFAQGWTAPLPKPWKERHPLAYAVVLLLIGAAIGWVGSATK